MSHQPNNVFAGTQVVALVEVRGTNNSLVHPRGAVGVVSPLPELPDETTRAALNDLLVRIRLATRTNSAAR